MMTFVYAENGWEVFEYEGEYVIFPEGGQVNEAKFYTEDQAREWTTAHDNTD